MSILQTTLLQNILRTIVIRYFSIMFKSLFLAQVHVYFENTKILRKIWKRSSKYNVNIVIENNIYIFCVKEIQHKSDIHLRLIIKIHFVYARREIKISKQK